MLLSWSCCTGCQLPGRAAWLPSRDSTLKGWGRLVSKAICSQVMYKDLYLYGMESDFDWLQNMHTDRHVRAKAEVSLAGKSGAASLRVAERDGEAEVDGDGDSWVAYLLLSCDKQTTLQGVTTDLPRRLKQQNGALKGGAKVSRAGRPWRVLCTVRGFIGKSEAFQFWYLWDSLTKASTTDGPEPEDVAKWAKYSTAHAVICRLAALETSRTHEDFSNLQVDFPDDEGSLPSTEEKESLSQQLVPGAPDS